MLKAIQNTIILSIVFKLFKPDRIESAHKSESNNIEQKCENPNDVIRSTQVLILPDDISWIIRDIRGDFTKPVMFICELSSFLVLKCYENIYFLLAFNEILATLNIRHFF